MTNIIIDITLYRIVQSFETVIINLVLQDDFEIFELIEEEIYVLSNRVSKFYSIMMAV